MDIQIYEEKVDVKINVTPQEVMAFMGKSELLANAIAKGIFAAFSKKLENAKIVAAPVPVPATKMEVHKNRKRHRRRH